jgi:hypothetical protein
MNWIHTMKKTLSITLLGALPLMAYAAGNVAEDTPPLADTGSAYYRFERLKVDSPDGHVHYRLDIAIPKRDAPTRGYPVMYLLDGNNVMAELRDDWLGPLNQGSPPLLVMIGYDIDERYDMPQRRRHLGGISGGAGDPDQSRGRKALCNRSVPANAVGAFIRRVVRAVRAAGKTRDVPDLVRCQRFAVVPADHV